MGVLILELAKGEEPSLPMVVKGLKTSLMELAKSNGGPNSGKGDVRPKHFNDQPLGVF